MTRNTTQIRVVDGLPVNEALATLGQTHDNTVNVLATSPKRVPYAMTLVYIGLVAFVLPLLYWGIARWTDFLPSSGWLVVIVLAGAVVVFAGARRQINLDMRGHRVALILYGRYQGRDQEWWLSQKLDAMVYTGWFEMDVAVPQCGMVDQSNPDLTWVLSVQISRPGAVYTYEALDEAVQFLVDMVTTKTREFAGNQVYGALHKARSLTDLPAVQAVARQIAVAAKGTAFSVECIGLVMDPPEDVRIAEERQALMDEILQELQETQDPGAARAMIIRIDNAKILTAEGRRELRVAAQGVAECLEQARAEAEQQQENQIRLDAVQGVVDGYHAARPAIEAAKKIAEDDPDGWDIYRFTLVVNAMNAQAQVAQAAVNKGLPVTISSVPALAEVGSRPSAQRRLGSDVAGNGQAGKPEAVEVGGTC